MASCEPSDNPTGCKLTNTIPVGLHVQHVFNSVLAVAQCSLLHLVAMVDTGNAIADLPHAARCMMHCIMHSDNFDTRKQPNTGLIVKGCVRLLTTAASTP